MRAYVNRGQRMKNDKTDNHEQLFWEEIDRLFPDMIKGSPLFPKNHIFPLQTFGPESPGGPNGRWIILA